ncbi:MAG TPA: multidrug transporter subunit MdtA, partial [Pantoea sp.]|nr:multidrug transporter subunit MdtA [Pantoea sp.]
MTNASRTSRSRWLKWLLLFILMVIIAGVVWRELPLGKGQGGMSPGDRHGGRGGP